MPSSGAATRLTQRHDARQFLAFQPFQERTAGGRDVGEVVVDAGLAQRGDGEVIGAAGVTGDTADNDEIAALDGVAAAGLEGVV